MPRTAAPKPEQVPADSKPTLDMFTKNIGFTPNMMATFAQSPIAFNSWAALLGSLSKALDVKTRDSIGLAVSEVNGCNEAWLPGELFFRKGLSGPWTHHLHILQGDDPRWQDRLLFRDYLRNHPEAARAYAKLKRDLAAAFDDDISGYRNAKDAFVAATMAEARARR